MIKRIVSGLTALAMILSSSFVSEFADGQLLSSTVITADAASDKDFDVNMYIADLMVQDGNPAVNGAVKNGLRFDSPGVILAQEMNKNELFMGSVAAWETLTFDTEKATSQQVNRIGYYETVILKSLESYFSSSFVKDTFDNDFISNSKRVWNIFTKCLKADASLKEADILNQTFTALSEADQEKTLKYITDAFSEAYPKIDDIGKYVGIFSDIVKVGKIAEKTFDNFCSYMSCCCMVDGMKDLVSDLYDKCDGLADPYMKQALANVNMACQSVELAWDATMFDAYTQGFAFAFGKATKYAFDAAIASNYLTFGIEISRQIGKNLSNILFSTDEICEQYYKLNCLKNYERLVKFVVKDEMNAYKSSRTMANAEKLLAAVDVMFNNYDNGCDMAISYADIVYKKGIAGLFPDNGDKYNNFVKSVNGNRENLHQEHIHAFNNFVFFLDSDYPELYEELMSAFESADSTAVEEVYFAADSVEWGLSDYLFYDYYAKVGPDSASDKTMTYSSSNPEVVTYINGQPVLYRAGTAVITAKSNDGGFTDTLNVTVVQGHGKDSYGPSLNADGEDEYLAAGIYNINESWTLTEDSVITADVVMSSNVDLNGHTLTVVGNLRQESGSMYIDGGTLNVSGWYKIQYENTTTNSTGVLIMDKDSDQVSVGGDFVTQSSVSTQTSYAYGYSYNRLTNGTMTIGGNFYQKNGSTYNFIGYSSHEVVFKGDKNHIIHFDSTNSYFNSLYTVDTSTLTFETEFKGVKLVKDITIDGNAVVSTGTLNLNGHTLTVNGDFTNKSDVYVNGGKLIVNGNMNVNSSLNGSKGTINVTKDVVQSGNIDLAGGTMSVDGNVRQKSGYMYIDGGTLNVSGWYKIQYENTTTNSTGVLIMDKDNDQISVGGDFVTQSSVSTQTSSVYGYSYNRLTNGTMTIGGNFYQKNGSTDNFIGYSSHEVVFKGDKNHIIHFDSTNSCFNSLYTVDTSTLTFETEFKGVKLVKDITIDGNAVVSTGTLDLNGHTLTVNGDFTNKSTVYVNGGKLIVNGNINVNSSLNGSKGTIHVTKDVVQSGNVDLAGGTMSVDGNLRQKSGYMYIDGGTLNVSGWYKIQYENTTTNSKGVLIMDKEADKINIGGDFVTQSEARSVTSGNNYAYNILSNGTMTIGGDFYQKNAYYTDNFSCSFAHEVIFKGDKNHKIYFDSTSSYFNLLYTIDTSTLSFETEFKGVKLVKDITIDGNAVMSAGSLDLNGHTLTVNGDFTNKSSVNVNEGKLIINGNMNVNSSLNGSKGTIHVTKDVIQSGNIDLAGGTMSVDGNLQQESGYMYIDGGTLNVAGWYKIQNENATSNSKGVLIMDKEADKINIGRDFVTQSEARSVTSGNNYAYNILSNGTMTIGGDFYQKNAYYTDNFIGYSNHKVILNGKGKHTVEFASNNSKFNILELTQPKSNYTFSYEPCWNKLICPSDAAKVEITLNANDTNLKTEDVTVALDSENVAVSENGSAQLTGLTDGEHELTFSAPDFVTRTYKVTVKDGAIVEDITPELNLIGDITGDGKLNAADLLRAKSHIKGVGVLTGYELKCADIDGNGKVNAADLLKLKAHIKGVTKLW